jgi:hypothetical protein
LKNYIAGSESKMQDTMNSFVSTHPIEPTPTLSPKNKRIISTNGVKVEKIVQSSREENRLIKSHHSQQHFDPNNSSVEKPLKPQYSSVSISRAKGPLNTSATSNNNDLNKSATLHHEENEFSSASASKINIMKMPKNKVSASPKIRTNISSEPTDIQTSQSGINNINSDAKPASAYIQGVQHTSSPKTKDIRSPGQQRAKIFSHVAVSKIKPINN